jgi:(p)ppGpp synthase/HD superfamily hydrolase
MEVVLALGLVNRGALAEVAGVKVVSILDFSDVAFVGQAREFAFKAHDGQMYGSTPYSEHLEETVQVLVTTLPDCPPELLAAAYLHDVLEDTFLTTDDLHEATSGRVVGLVDACTDGKGQNRRERKERPFELIPKRPDSILVKLADRIANAERCRATGDSRLNMYRKEHSVFIARLNHAPTSPGLSPKPLWERLTNALSNSG